MTHRYAEIASRIRLWGREAGFQQTGITDLELDAYRPHYEAWIAQHYHGEMEYMQRHASLRTNPSLLHEGALRCITFRMDYLPSCEEPEAILADPQKAYISRYALGRDYHRLIRKRLAAIAEKIEAEAWETLNQRAFVDSAPLLERAFAEKSGLGWIGKNTMLIHPKAGSFFFLGEILTNLPLPVDPPQPSSHCGSCEACIPACPTGAILAPGTLDARRCISYLTIELKGSIPEDLRPLMGNRIFGCDDCQLCCPWNKFARSSEEKKFSPRHGLDHANLLTLFLWGESEFLTKTEGSPIRRAGYESWQRNLAVALGNAPFSETIRAALANALSTASTLVAEHIRWAIAEMDRKEKEQICIIVTHHHPSKKLP